MPVDTNATKLTDLINPEVMADLISAELPNLIRFAPLAEIDYTLVGQPGDTLTVPKNEPIADAQDVAEGSDIPVSKRSTATTTVKVKKIGNSVELTDESVLSGLGNVISDSVYELMLSIANKVDNDCLAAAKKATLSHSTAAGNTLTVEDVIAAKAKFGENMTKGVSVLVVNSTHYTDLVTSDKWVNTDKGVQIFMDGVVGFVGGCQVIISDKLADTEAFIIKPGALGILMKRSVMVEQQRNPGVSTKVVVTEHYGAYLKSDKKIVKINITA